MALTSWALPGVAIEGGLVSLLVWLAAGLFDRPTIEGLVPAAVTVVLLSLISTMLARPAGRLIGAKTLLRAARPCDVATVQ